MQIFFVNSRDRKNHNFLRHYQLGGHCPFEAWLIQIKRFDYRLPRYLISFEQHSEHYNSYDADEIIEKFLNLFALKLVPQPNLEKIKIKANFSTLNFQLPEQNGFVQITDIRIWSMDV